MDSGCPEGQVAQGSAGVDEDAERELAKPAAPHT